MILQSLTAFSEIHNPDFILGSSRAGVKISTPEIGVLHIVEFKNISSLSRKLDHVPSPRMTKFFARAKDWGVDKPHVTSPPLVTFVT